MATMGYKIDAHEVDNAAMAFDRLTLSIERASEAMRNLNGAEHGGIRVTSVGEITEIIIKPATSDLMFDPRKEEFADFVKRA